MYNGKKHSRVEPVLHDYGNYMKELVAREIPPPAKKQCKSAKPAEPTVAPSMEGRRVAAG